MYIGEMLDIYLKLAELPSGPRGILKKKNEFLRTFKKFRFLRKKIDVLALFPGYS